MIMYDNDCYIFYQIDTVKLFALKSNFISRESVSWNDNIYEK